MKIMDKTGRGIEVGQVVDMPLLGTFQGMIMEITEAPLVLSREQVIPPHLKVQIIATPAIMPNGYVDRVYIIGEADPENPLVIASRKARHSLGLVK